MMQWELPVSKGGCAGDASTSAGCKGLVVEPQRLTIEGFQNIVDTETGSWDTLNISKMFKHKHNK